MGTNSHLVELSELQEQVPGPVCGGGSFGLGW